jgi:hypothetical protein
MRRLLAGLACCIAAPAIAADAPAASPFAIALAPKKMHEECVKLDAGDKRKYYWKADGPVDFNIHYHEATEVFYPVKREAMRGDGGVFVAKIAREYCWMWTARDKPVKLEGRIGK